MINKKYLFFLVFILFNITIKAQGITGSYKEKYHPQIHFSPQAHWINDPNGMVYYKGIYHLFFQYYPYGTTWGPMHWGHATSKDLIHWQQKPIALYPDSLGYIFSGSAVVDKENTSGFGKNGKIPLVAIFTQHDPIAEKEGKNNFQNQSIAFSLNNGETWKKYAHNPVLKNPGITDFRDPKVSWYAPGKKWIMTLATKDHITFYSSPNLKQWKKESEFGKNIGAHGGVWECPDLFPMNFEGRKVWVLLVSINPGGPNAGSATQYFTGNFDGKSFTTADTTTKWIDYGPDDYAGVLWSNTGDRKIFLGWMSNWLYANVVPTKNWRGAMTIPRNLGIQKLNGKFYITSTPVKELDKLDSKTTILKKIIKGKLDISSPLLVAPFRLNLSLNKAENFSLIFYNNNGEKLVIGYQKVRNSFFINRENAGKSFSFSGIANISYAPRIATNKDLQLSLIVDKASVELFADNGLTTMTATYFSDKSYNKLQIHSESKIIVNKIEIKKMKSIWN